MSPGDAVAEISARGGVFAREPRDEGYGITTALEVPGADPIMLYQPRHTTAYDL